MDGDRFGPRSVRASKPKTAPKRATALGPVEAAWSPPDDIDDGFETRMGSAIVEEFVAGHDATDVLRELVQNEFDAGGETMTVTFGLSGLTVSGSGRAIDKEGWDRLNVVMGTGRVVGDKAGATIRAKQNGIGSKNFGLRSLFLFGDRIHVRSAGRMAVLDLPRLGTQVVKDPGSSRRKGIHIYVPYRAEPYESLAPFTVEREAATLDKMAGGLLATLVKLATSGRRKGVREVVLTSERSGRRLVWRQSVETVACKIEGVSALRRVGRLSDEKIGSGKRATTASFEELEFSRAVDIPSDHTGLNFPSYYDAGKGALRVNVSLPIQRKAIDLKAAGRFHYPLQAPNSPTGMAIGVSAPFKLDPDRSELLDNAWNSWLAMEAAGLVTSLFSADWVRRYGSDAYLALRATGPAAPSNFAEAIQGHLRSAACWASADDGKLAKASDMVAPEQAEFSGFLGAHRYLAPALASVPAVSELLVASGAKPFGLNSLVRLRCAGQAGQGLETKVPSGDADFWYTNYEAALLDSARQVAFAKAFGAAAKRLSNPNRVDLKTTPSTLAADGKLRAASGLILVPEDIWDVCPEPAASRLHRSLVGEKVVSGLCTPFDLDQWIQNAAGRIAQGRIDEGEREALYRHLLSEDLTLSPKAMAAVRRSPVMRSHRQEWIAPERMVQLAPAHARLLGPAIHMPSAEMAKNANLLRRLRLRRTLVGEDLVAFAATLVDMPAATGAFENLLKANVKLLTPKVVEALRPLAFLRAASGKLAAPADLHLDNAVTRICVADEDRILDGRNLQLYRALGCREHPTAATMLGTLAQARSGGMPPLQPEVFYPALVAALRNERIAPEIHAAEPILWVMEAYRAPQDVLVGTRIPSWFGGAAPHYRGPAPVVEAFEALGAATQPRDRHWIELFSWCHERRKPDEVVTVLERKMLREAYRLRGIMGLPAGLGDTIRCLLARDGRLYSLQDLRAGWLVEDDYPALAMALQDAGAKIAFADLVEQSRSFFHNLGLGRLSVSCGLPRLSAGPEGAAPSWYRARPHGMALLSLVHREDFQVAIYELAWAHQRQSPGFKALSSRELKRRLAAIDRLVFVTGVTRVYKVGGKSAAVAAEAGVFEDRIALTPARTKFEYDQMLAYALAELAGAAKIVDARPLAVAILPLLMGQTSADMFAYLTRQGIKPAAWVEVDDLVEPEPPQDAPESQTAADIVRGLVATLTIETASETETVQAQPSAQIPPPIVVSPPPPPTPPPTFTLPSLEEVNATQTAPTGRQAPPRPASGGGGGFGGYGGGWSPPTWADIERDRLVGARGEELVFLAELERVRSFGHAEPEKYVVWTSRANPGADHDIRSIDVDGRPIWIEVKSTTGVDGRFEWSQREFEKALREGPRYVLWRVYQAASTHPTLKPFTDPAAMLARAELSLEIGGLRGFVEGEGG